MDVVDVVQRRAVGEHRSVSVVGAHERADVTGLELVGGAGQSGQVRHAVQGGSGAEDGRAGECRQDGEASGGGAAHRDASGVDLAGGGEELGSGDDVIGVVDAPVAVERVPVTGAVAG